MILFYEFNFIKILDLYNLVNYFINILIILSKVINRKFVDIMRNIEVVKDREFNLFNEGLNDMLKE